MSIGRAQMVGLHCLALGEEAQRGTIAKLAKLDWMKGG